MQKANFLRQMFWNISDNQTPVHINIENQGSRDLVKNLIHQLRSKHIDVK